MRRRWGMVATSALLGLALGGCTAAAPPMNTTTPPPALGTGVDVIGVLGDSISLGVNACSKPGPCTSDSWVGGTTSDVQSIASRLEAAEGQRPEVVFAAKDGGDVAQALAQVDGLLAREPDLVTILVGANDVCAASVQDMTSVETFRTDLAQIVDRVQKARPEARMLMPSIPDLNQLWTIGSKIPAVTDKWNGSGSCQNLLRDSSSNAPQDEARRAAVAARVDELNAVITEVCSSSTSCIDDGGAVHAYDFSPSEISRIDYFHPSAEGQRAIADIGWQTLMNAEPR